MTDLPPGADDQSPDATPDAPIDSGRASSVRLRDGEDSARTPRAARMDAANQSLADALRITYTLVRVAMVVLVVLFVFSGVRTIKEGQRGISTRFGEIRDSGLEPGAHLTWPYPVGELVPIDTGIVELRIDRAYFPFVRPGEEDTQESDLPYSNQLKPGRDGSLITADQNIAHAQFSVRYRRDGHSEYARNISPEFERDLVRMAIGRGVVRAAAETVIDDLLKDSPIADRARDIAQGELDELDSGIRIESVIMRRKFAPVSVLEQFRRVLTASQASSEARTYARASAERILNTVAGAASGRLIEEIDAYERAVELGETDNAEQILARIDELLDSPDVSGEVKAILSESEQRAIQVVNDARAGLELFEGVSKQYEANASLTLTQEWSSAMTTFLSRPTVQSFLVREGNADDMRLWINADPDYVRAQNTAERERQLQESSEERERMRVQDRFRSQRGIIRDDGQ